jgi:hypothetical protein
MGRKGEDREGDGDVPPEEFLGDRVLLPAEVVDYNRDPGGKTGFGNPRFTG